jgi:YebC/PmpR family DNA-binding regulatory protein
MSGHSKWAQIKRKKGTADEKRGQLFSKISRTITLAAREGEANPNSNSKLRLAIDKAKAVNMPKDVIERAIAKAVNKDEGALEEFLYEAYGPGGIALLIEGITDNKNRSTQEIKHLVLEGGGKFVPPGTVAWLFEKKGVIEIIPEKNTLSADDIELCAIDAGVDTIEKEGGLLNLLVDPQAVKRIKEALQEKSVVIDDGHIEYIPKSKVAVDKTEEEKIFTFLDTLEGHDDVQEVYTNLE